jgi:hypothetical protein
MIKHINHQNVSTTPFVAAKSRDLYNTQNPDSLITEAAVYPDGTHIALDYVNYNSGNPILNRDCDIALEQQDADLIQYEEGITGSGTFNSASDPRNSDGTYKTLVHRQIENAFYNTYRNPTEIFGVEHIDFPLSKTLRNLSDHFRMFTVPRSIFGDKIQPKSVQFFDTLFDDNVAIFDDGYQNLIAGYNLFSKVQEVRTFPSGAGYQNAIFPGSSSNDCPTIDSLWVTDPKDQIVYQGFTASFSVTASGALPLTYQWISGSTYLVDGSRITGSNTINGTTSSLFINNVQFSDAGTYKVHVTNAYGRSVDSNTALLTVLDTIIVASMHDSASSDLSLRFGNYGDTSTIEPIVSTFASFLSGYIFDTVIPTYGDETASVDNGFESGYIFDTIIPIYGGNETASVDSGFDSGYIFDVIIPIYGGNETASVDSGFDSGYTTLVVTPAFQVEPVATFTVGFLTGSISGSYP